MTKLEVKSGFKKAKGEKVTDDLELAIAAACVLTGRFDTAVANSPLKRSSSQTSYCQS